MLKLIFQRIEMGDTLDLKLTTQCSYLFGVPYPIPDDYSQWSRAKWFFWTIYRYAINVFIFVEAIVLIVRIIVEPNNLGVVCACCAGIFYVFHYILKLWIFGWNKKLYERLFDEMRNISKELSTNPFDGEFRKHHDKVYYGVVKVCIFNGGMQSVGAVILSIIFIISGFAVGVPEDGITPGMSWTPFDKTKNPEYTMVCLFEMISFTSASLRNTAMNILFLLMLMEPVIQLRYLSHLLKIIMANETPHVKHNFLVWIRFHQRVLRSIEEFKKVTSPFLAVDYLISLIMLVSAGLVALSSTSWTILQKLIISAIMILNISQLYAVSLTGDWLDESNENATLEGFTDRLFCEDKSVRRDYLFVCARSKSPLRIRFGGINPLSSETFERLLRLTITYFVTIVQLRG